MKPAVLLVVLALGAGVAYLALFSEEPGRGLEPGAPEITPEMQAAEAEAARRRARDPEMLTGRAAVRVGVWGEDPLPDQDDVEGTSRDAEVSLPSGETSLTGAYALGLLERSAPVRFQSRADWDAFVALDLKGGLQDGASFALPEISVWAQEHGFEVHIGHRLIRIGRRESSE